MKTIDQIAQFFNDSEYFTGSVKLNENLAKHTTMHVGGSAKLFLEPENEDSLVFAIKKLGECVHGDTQIKSFFVLGGGSNVIISDDGLDAVISTRKMNKIKFLTESTEIIFSVKKSLCSLKLCEGLFQFLKFLFQLAGLFLFTDSDPDSKLGKGVFDCVF